MAFQSKRIKDAKKRVEASEKFSVADGVEKLKAFPSPKFDETVDLVFKLGVDPKKSDQVVRGTLSLPHGIGKSRKVIVFAEGEKAREADEAGADEVGGTVLAGKIQGGWLDFDVAIAAPDMMKHVGRLGRILGPQGKMPSPKSGTVTADVAKAVKEFKAGKIEYRVDKDGNCHTIVGKKSFPEEKLAENIEFIVAQIRAARPATAKGTYIQKVVLSASMSPGVKLDVK